MCTHEYTHTSILHQLIVGVTVRLPVSLFGISGRECVCVCVFKRERDRESQGKLYPVPQWQHGSGSPRFVQWPSRNMAGIWDQQAKAELNQLAAPERHRTPDRPTQEMHSIPQCESSFLVTSSHYLVPVFSLVGSKVKRLKLCAFEWTCADLFASFPDDVSQRWSLLQSALRGRQNNAKAL